MLLELICTMVLRCGCRYNMFMQDVAGTSRFGYSGIWCTHVSSLVHACGYVRRSKAVCMHVIPEVTYGVALVSTVASREIETTVFDTASQFLSNISERA